jgi:hypothetical protein
METNASKADSSPHSMSLLLAKKYAGEKSPGKTPTWIKDSIFICLDLDAVCVCRECRREKHSERERQSEQQGLVPEKTPTIVLHSHLSGRCLCYSLVTQELRERKMR